MDSSPILKKNMPKNALRKGKNSYRTCLAQTFWSNGVIEIILHLTNPRMDLALPNLIHPVMVPNHQPRLRLTKMKEKNVKILLVTNFSNIVHL